MRSRAARHARLGHLIGAAQLIGRDGVAFGQRRQRFGEEGGVDQLPQPFQHRDQHKKPEDARQHFEAMHLRGGNLGDLTDEAGFEHFVADLIKQKRQASAAEQALQPFFEIVLPRILHPLAGRRQVAAAHFVSGPPPSVALRLPIRLAFLILLPAGFPFFGVLVLKAFLPTVHKVCDVALEFFGINAPRARPFAAAAERVIDQLQIGAARFTESLPFDGLDATFRTVHFRLLG